MRAVSHVCEQYTAVRSLKLLGGGQSAVQKGTLLMMMIWHQKKGTCSPKGHFFPRLPGGQLRPLPPPLLGTSLQYHMCMKHVCK